MNFLRNRSIACFFACLFIVSVPVQANDPEHPAIAFIKGLNLSLSKGENGSTDITIAKVVIGTTVALVTYEVLKSAETPLDYIKSCLPVKSWKENYERKQEEKQLDKELADAAFAEKRAKVMKLRNQSRQ